MSGMRIRNTWEGRQKILLRRLQNLFQQCKIQGKVQNGCPGQEFSPHLLHGHFALSKKIIFFIKNYIGNIRSMQNIVYFWRLYFKLIKS